MPEVPRYDDVASVDEFIAVMARMGRRYVAAAVVRGLRNGGLPPSLVTLLITELTKAIRHVPNPKSREGLPPLSLVVKE